jgi:transcription elongation factor GreB
MVRRIRGRGDESEGGALSYITPEGEARLRAEVERLWSEERPRVTREVKAAAALGDRSENAEYIYGKKRLREIDARLRFLSKRLDRLTVVSEVRARDGRAYFGSWVTVENEAGEHVRYRLVGPDESDVDKGDVSIESPVGRALLGKQEGDEVVIHRPKGELALEVVAVDYDPPER